MNQHKWLNQAEAIYETVLAAPRLYRCLNPLGPTKEVRPHYQLLTHQYLTIFLSQFKPWQLGEVPGAIQEALQEFYWIHPVTGHPESLYDTFVGQLLDQIYFEGNLEEGLAEEAPEEWVTNLSDAFFQSKRHWEDWTHLEQVLIQSSQQRKEQLMSEPFKEALYQGLDQALKRHLQAPLMLKSRVYHRLNQSLVLLEFTPSPLPEIRREIHQILQLDASFFDTITPQEAILSQLVVHLEFIPQSDQLPTWDYETVLDLLWEQFGQWIQEYYGLTDEEVFTDTLQEIQESLWDEYWKTRGLEAFVACCEQCLKAS